MTNSGMLALFVAISLSAGTQKPAPVPGAASDQALARACAQILRAAQQRDFALLIPVLDDPVEINFREQLTRRGLKALVRGLKDDAEAKEIQRSLEDTNWNRKLAARLLNISYRGLLYKIREHGITRLPGGESVPYSRNGSLN